MMAELSIDLKLRYEEEITPLLIYAQIIEY